jgi:tRNA A-37 threonylcarbamoyl transferase component Bud32
MHRAGILHGDLQVRNILVTPHGGLVLDFANASAYGRLFPRRDLKRLKRSFVKLGLPLEVFDEIQRAYDAAGPS